MRKRMIDPGYWSDDKVIELTPIERLLFIGMWNFADDSGVLKNSSKQLKAQIFPADNIDDNIMKKHLSHLHELGLIQLNEDKTLIKVRGWTNYQKINRPQPSKYAFVEGNHGTFSECSVNTHGTITPNRIEEKGIEVSIIEKNTSKNLLVQTDKEFEQFYSLYPRKVSKKATIKAWNRLNKKDRTLAMDALPKHIKHWKDKGTEMDYIKHPSSWLNGRHFEDEISVGVITNELSKEDDEKERASYYKQLKELQKNAATPKERMEALSAFTKKERSKSVRT